MLPTKLSPPQDLGVLRFLTCGSVDDGKSTLIGRLLYDTRAILVDTLQALASSSRRRGGTLDLALLTDGLQAEREQGITIDVAYRYFSTGRRAYILADSPGHEQYTRNMVTAASTADLAILLVDARRGLLPQTRRHAALARLMGIRHLVVAVNKMDLVDYSEAVFNGIRRDFEAFAAALGPGEVRFVPLSALAGDMVVDRGPHLDWYAGPTLLELLESTVVEDGRRERPFRFPVQLVIRRGDFRGYGGRVESGEIRVGDPVVALPSGLRSRVRSLRLGEVPLDRASTGQSVTLQLDDDLDVSRGDLFAGVVGAPLPSRSLEATLCWLSETPLALHRRYLLRHGTREVRATVQGLRDRLSLKVPAEADPLSGNPLTGLGLNDIATAALRLQGPLAAEPYAHDRATGAFVLIDEATHATVGAGLIRSLA